MKKSIKNNSLYIYGKGSVGESLKSSPKNIKQIYLKEGAQGRDFDTLTGLAKKNKIPVHQISKAKMQDYIGDMNSQGIIAELVGFQYADLNDWLAKIDIESSPAVVVLDHVEDPHNFGAIIRSAVAAGASGIIVAKDNQAPVNGTVFKTSAGLVPKIPIIQVSNIIYAMESLKKAEFWLHGLHMDAEENIWTADMNGAIAFVIGGEGKGISKLVHEKCDFIISIPMEDEIDSLNVSVATALILYEWKRKNSGNMI